MKRILTNISFFVALAVIGLSTVRILNVIGPNTAPTLAVIGLKPVSGEGSGVLKTESREVGTFTSIDVSGAYNVEIVSQQTPSIEISGEENILPLIITEVRGNTLYIYNNKNIYPTNKLKVKISTRNIEKLSASGASNIKVSNVNNEKLNIAQSGFANTQISGKTKELYITLSGAANIDAKNLYSEKVKVDISGTSNTDVYATEELNVSVFGVGNVNYYGSPKTVSRNIAGIGSINKK